MKKFNNLFRFLIIFLLLINTTSCKISNISNNYDFIIFRDKITGEKENITKKERKIRLTEDLDFFKEALLAFPSNFNNFSVEDFKEKIEELKSNIDNLKDLDFFIELQKIVVMFKEGHISLKKNKRAYLELESVLIDNDIHIKSSFVDDEFQYGKLIRINDTDVETIKKKFRKIISADNYSNFLLYMDITDVDLLKGLKIIDDVNKVNLTLEKNGKEKNFLIDPIFKDNYYPISSRNYFLKNRNEYNEISEKYKRGEKIDSKIPKMLNAYNYIQNIEKKSIVFNYNHCFEDIDKDYLKFFEELSKVIESQKKDDKLDRIIVDLRRNSGGSRYVIKPFIDFSKKFFEKNKDVKLIILTDRNTVSAGMLAVMDLRNTTKNYVVVGLSPSGGINFAGGVIEEIMPNSKIVFSFTTRYISRGRYDTIEAETEDNPDTTEEEFSKNMLIPDVKAYKTVEDYENNTDSVLERALNGEFDKVIDKIK